MKDQLVDLSRYCFISWVSVPIIGRCAGRAKVSSFACRAIDWMMPVVVGIFTAQMLQDAQLTYTGAQRKQSTPTDAEIGQNALTMRRVSNQQSVGAVDHYDSVLEGEWGCHSGRRPVRAAMRRAHCAAIVSATLIVPVCKTSELLVERARAKWEHYDVRTAVL
jgi:hypothetical protein